MKFSPFSLIPIFLPILIHQIRCPFFPINLKNDLLRFFQSPFRKEKAVPPQLSPIPIFDGAKSCPEGTKMEEEEKKEEGGGWEIMSQNSLERTLAGRDSKILGYISQTNGDGREEEIVEIHGKRSADLGEEGGNGGLSPIPSFRLQRTFSDSQKDKIEWEGGTNAPLIKHGSDDIARKMRMEKKKPKLCSKKAIRKLGEFQSEKVEGENSSKAEDDLQPKCLSFFIKCVKKKKRIKKEGEFVEGKLNRKGAIRMALRKYLCDKTKQKLGKYWTHFEEEEEGVERMEMKFERFDSNFGHHFEFDFTFTVFFPKDFDKLTQMFGVDDYALMHSLTVDNLKELNVDSKGGCQLFTSSDDKFFLKSVRMEPKNILGLNFMRNTLEPIVEKDFFFKHQTEGQFVNWTEEERKGPDENAYRGGFRQYLAHMEGGTQTLLPKYFMLFHFQPHVDGKTPRTKKEDPPNPNGIPMLFTVQNGLFPHGMRKLEYKFDLKGSRADRLAKGETKAILKDANFVKFEKDGTRRGFFPNGIHLSAEDYEKIQKMIRDDSEFLSKLTIIDYSLLMGVHLDEEGRMLEGDENFAKDDGYFGNAAINEGEDKKVRIFIGIVDILQPYILVKKVETGIKKIKNIGRSISFDDTKKTNYLPMSVISPQDYKKRFEDFITSVVFHGDKIQIN